MRGFVIAALVLAFTVVFAADTQARRYHRRNFYNRSVNINVQISRYPRVISFWSPGILVGWFTQGTGGPRMVHRGDWVPISELRGR